MFQAVAGPASSRLINQSGRPRSIYRSPQIDGPLRTDSSNRSAAIRSPNSHVTCFYNHLSIGKSLHPPTRPPSHHHRPASATPAPPQQSQTNRARSTFLQSICKNQIKDNKKKKIRKPKPKKKSKKKRKKEKELPKIHGDLFDLFQHGNNRVRLLRVGCGASDVPRLALFNEHSLLIGRKRAQPA